jgi:hypothetical protein
MEASSSSNQSCSSRSKEYPSSALLTRSIFPVPRIGNGLEGVDDVGLGDLLLGDQVPVTTRTLGTRGGTADQRDEEAENEAPLRVHGSAPSRG